MNNQEPMSLNSSHESRLREIIREIGPMLVAYSGGLDSAYLLKVAHEELGPDAVAVTAVSASLPEADRQSARAVAIEIGARQIEIESDELNDVRYTENTPQRCYFCKSELFEKLKIVAADLGIPAIVYGANLDDIGDFRPGMVAAREGGIRAPLLEAGLGKAMIRDLSRAAGLSTWDLPARPCLSSRIPHGIAVTPERLGRIERAEAAVARLGFRQFRVRFHEDVARIEVDPSEFGKLMEDGTREQILEGVRSAGFRYVAIDLEGYRQGSLNPVR